MPTDRMRLEDAVLAAAVLPQTARPVDCSICLDLHPLDVLIVWVTAWLFLLGCAAIILCMAGLHMNGMPHRRDTPLDILKRRYARGELPPDEYRRMKREISG